MIKLFINVTALVFFVFVSGEIGEKDLFTDKLAILKEGTSIV